MNGVHCLLVVALLASEGALSKPPAAAPSARAQARREIGRARLQDSTRVVLFSDSTWTSLPAADSSEPLLQRGSLEITAGVVLVSNETRPMARMTISLLDADLGQALADLAIRTSAGDEKKAKRAMGDIWAHYSAAVAGLRGNQFDKPGTVENFIRTFVEAHTVRATMTNFAGKAMFDSLPPGTYSVHATNMQGYHPLLWDVPVTTLDGRQSVVLDNSNAR
jgi:hypothetical protein